MNCECKLNSEYMTWEDRLEYSDWEFTGRIKYVKYMQETIIKLEIKYHWFGGKYKTVWLSELLFEFIEIPEEVIIECDKNH